MSNDTLFDYIFVKDRKRGGWKARLPISSGADGSVTYQGLDGDGDYPSAEDFADAPSKTVKEKSFERWTEDAEPFAAGAPLTEVLALALSPDVGRPLRAGKNVDGSDYVEPKDEEDDSLKGIDFDGSGSPTAPSPSSAPSVGQHVKAVLVEDSREFAGECTAVHAHTCEIAATRFSIYGRRHPVVGVINIEVPLTALVSE